MGVRVERSHLRGAGFEIVGAEWTDCDASSRCAFAPRAAFHDTIEVRIFINQWVKNSDIARDS